MKIESLLKEIQERKVNKTVHIASGACKDYVEYRQVCGAIEELTIVEDIILDTLRKEESLDE